MGFVLDFIGHGYPVRQVIAMEGLLALLQSICVSQICLPFKLILIGHTTADVRIAPEIVVGALVFSLEFKQAKLNLSERENYFRHLIRHTSCVLLMLDFREQMQAHSYQYDALGPKR